MNLTKRPVYEKGQKRRRVKLTDRPYLDWLEEQPCCHCKRFPPSEPAHVRLGGRGAMARKPLFSAVPLCHDCHALQHNSSHLALMTTEEWLRQADFYLTEWKKSLELRK